MSTNTASTIKEVMNGIGGISQASTGQTGGQRAMGMAQLVSSIMALMA